MLTPIVPWHTRGIKQTLTASATSPRRDPSNANAVPLGCDYTYLQHAFSRPDTTHPAAITLHRTRALMQSRITHSTPMSSYRQRSLTGVPAGWVRHALGLGRMTMGEATLADLSTNPTFNLLGAQPRKQPCGDHTSAKRVVIGMATPLPPPWDRGCSLRYSQTLGWTVYLFQHEPGSATCVQCGTLERPYGCINRRVYQDSCQLPIPRPK
jgi:hypothetical protein